MKKSKENPPKRGRPSQYREEFDEQARKLCMMGATDKQLAAFFEVSEQTVNAWKVQHPSFFESLKAGKILADAEVAHSLYRRAIGYSHPEDDIKSVGGEIIITPTTKHYPPDSTAMIFWLKNRQPEKWRAQPEDGGEAPTPVKVVFQVTDASVPEPDAGS